jgi:hypothetical protein
MPVSPEVNSLQREVGGHEGLVAGGYPKHGCIVADAGYDVTSLSRLTSEAKNQRFLSEGHGEANIDDNPFRPKLRVCLNSRIAI